MMLRDFALRPEHQTRFCGPLGAGCMAASLHTQSCGSLLDMSVCASISRCWNYRLVAGTRLALQLTLRSVRALAPRTHMAAEMVSPIGDISGVCVVRYGSHQQSP